MRSAQSPSSWSTTSSPIWVGMVEMVMGSVWKVWHTAMAFWRTSAGMM